MSETLPKPAFSRAVLSSNSVKFRTDSVRIGAGIHSHESSNPKVEIIRDGDTIIAIEVICSCGERIRLLCDYD
jgi:hypothetical protein